MNRYDLAMDEAIEYLNRGLSKTVKHRYDGTPLSSLSDHPPYPTDGVIEERPRQYYIGSVEIKGMIRDGILPCEMRGEDYYFSVDDLKPIRDANDMKIAKKNIQRIIVMFVMGTVFLYAMFSSMAH